MGRVFWLCTHNTDAHVVIANRQCAGASSLASFTRFLWKTAHFLWNTASEHNWLLSVFALVRWIFLFSRNSAENSFLLSSFQAAAADSSEQMNRCFLANWKIETKLLTTDVGECVSNFLAPLLVTMLLLLILSDSRRWVEYWPHSIEKDSTSKHLCVSHLAAKPQPSTGKTKLRKS